MTRGWAFLLAGISVVVPSGIVLYGRALDEKARVAHLEESALRWETPKVFLNGFKLQVEHHTNTDFLTYHVSVRVTAVDGNSPNRELLRDLYEVNGVGNIIFTPYEITIQKGQMFEWYEMQPSLETVIRRHLEPPAPAQQ